MKPAASGSPATSTAEMKGAKQSDADLLKTAGKWSKQLPNRLLSVIFEFSGGKEVATAISVCQSWRLPSNLLNKAIQRLYLNDFEKETVEDKRIAVDGAETSWMVRYKRRYTTESNFRNCTFKQRTVSAGRFRSYQKRRAGAHLVFYLNDHILTFDWRHEQFIDKLRAPAGIGFEVVESDGTVLYVHESVPNADRIMNVRVYSVPELKQLDYRYELPAGEHQMRNYGKCGQLFTDGELLAAVLGNFISLWSVKKGKFLGTCSRPPSLRRICVDFLQNDAIIYGVSHELVGIQHSTGKTVSKTALPSLEPNTVLADVVQE